jgi:hypothetical protein
LNQSPFGDNSFGTFGREVQQLSESGVPNSQISVTWVMKKQTREQLMALTRPVFRGVIATLGVIYNRLFWWLDILSQRRENAALTDDIEANLYFLYSRGEIVKEPWLKTAVHPFDYAVVKITYNNVCFSITRGQEQLNVLVSPRHNPRDTHDFYIVAAALDATDMRELKPYKYLSDLAELLRPRMNALNDAFSESRYSEFSEKLSCIDRELDVMRRQAEWDLNRRIYP